MSRTQTQAPKFTEQQVEESSEFQRLVQKNLTAVEYTPFGQERDIKLDFYQVKRLVSARTKSGAVADDDEIWRFMKRCEALRANPYTNDIYLIGYDSKDGPKFSAVTSISYMLKRAEVNPAFRGIVSGVVVVDAACKLTEREGDFVANGESLAGAWCKVFRADREHPFYNCIRRDVYAKNSPLWQAMEAHMTVKCCRADVLRTAFPSELGGMYAEEEFQMLLHTPKANEAVKRDAKADLRNMMQAPLKMLASGSAETPTQQDEEPPPPAIEWNIDAFAADLAGCMTPADVSECQQDWSASLANDPERLKQMNELCEDRRQALKGGA